MSDALFADGEAYENYVGRWSRLVARDFLDWLRRPPGLRLLDVGCGTGELARTALLRGGAASVVGIDASESFLKAARHAVADPRVSWHRGDAQALPYADGAFDAAISGLVLNFVPDRAKMIAEMARVARPGGVVALYVWDYGGEMQLMRYFWDAAVAIDPDAAALDEGRCFPVCRPEPLRDHFDAAGLRRIATKAIDIPTVFRDFDDYWRPFAAGRTGPAPVYCASLDEDRRSTLRALLAERLPRGAGGGISLIARAWAVKGQAPRNLHRAISRRRRPAVRAHQVFAGRRVEAQEEPPRQAAPAVEPLLEFRNQGIGEVLGRVVIENAAPVIEPGEVERCGRQDPDPLPLDR